jgi:ABC-2 type transport system ATP-binding protein
VSTSQAIIEVRDVSKRYGRTLALDGVSLQVEEGELFALLGPNGAGKTTLIHILCTIQAPDTGSARIAGFDVVKKPLLARQRIGVVFQESSLDTRLTVAENLEFHGRIYGVPPSLRRARIRDLLELVELTKWRDHLVRSLSSGMKRRLEIARALIHESRVLFLDEPTVGLDPQSRERIWEYVGKLREERGLTTLVTTHYIGEVETCVFIIDHGKILASGTPDALKEEHGQEILRIQPRDLLAADAIAARYREQVVQRNGELLLAAGPGVLEQFIAEHGGSIRTLSVEKPTLESVFLSLTCRELRDQAATPRERTLAFGKQGGEHTR